MKKLFILLVVSFFILSSANAQMSVPTGKSDLSVKVYAGILSAFYIADSQFTSKPWNDFRVGGLANFNATKWLEVKSYATWGSCSGVNYNINSFSFRVHNEHLWVEIGRMATPATELRPLPPSAGGQFETYAQAVLPGGNIGIKAGYKVSKNLYFEVGKSVRGRQPEYSALVSYKDLLIAYDYQQLLHKTTAGASINAKRFYGILSYRKSDVENIIAFMTNVNIVPSAKIHLYLDSGYSVLHNSFPRLEGGIIRNFDAGHVHGLLAVGYSHETRSFKTYLWIHL